MELFFPGERTGVIRAMRRLEKNRQIFRNSYTGLVSSSGFAYSVKDEGTIRPEKLGVVKRLTFPEGGGGEGEAQRREILPDGYRLKER